METLYFRICVLLGLLADVVLAALLFRRPFADFHELVRRTPKWQRAFLALLAAVWIAYGSTKTNQIDGVSVGDTNQVENGEVQGGEAVSRPLLMESPPLLASGWESASPLSVTPADIARGWQPWEKRTNCNVSYAMPDGAILATNWWVRGAFEDALKIGLNPTETALHPAPGTLHQTWRFPFGTNACSSLWAFSWGKVRFRFDDTNEIVAVGLPMSAVPYRSRLWTLETNNAFLVTWEGFTLGRVPSANCQLPSANCQLVSAQIELRRNGDFVTRSNAVETACRRICPEDLDDDGIPNSRDPRPYFRDGDFFGPRQALPEGADSNAYCWVEIAADMNAHVVFTGDGESDLPDPDFMLRAGETNRVTLLIGKTYSVESSQPLTVTGRSSAAIEVGGNGSRDLTVVWPVDVCAMEGNGASFMMRVEPDSIGGEFEWAECCCPITGSGRVFTWGCNGLCLCTGCTALGALTYEGYSIPVTGGHCGCSFGPHPPSAEPDGGQMVAGVSASFSPEAVIFEDAYTNMPGSVVYGRSTETVLSCTVHGGFRGGTASFSFAGETNLVWVRGAAVPRSAVTIPPGEKLEFAAVYKGLRPSAEAEDITYTVTFTENDTTNAPATATAKLTSVKLQLTAVYDAPENPNPSRHIYGVGEKVRFGVEPVVSDAILSVVKKDVGDKVTPYDLFEVEPGVGTDEVTVSGENVYRCPATDTAPSISLRYNGCVYRPEMSVVEPQLVATREATGSGTFWPGDVVMGILTTRNHVGPFHVSFSGVQIYEVPCTNAIPPTGYFATTNYTGPLTHAYPNAGWLHIPDDTNFWATDEAGRDVPYSNWSAGALTWNVPIGWRRIRRGEETLMAALEVDYALYDDKESRPLLIGGREDAYIQTFEIESDGTSSVRKFKYKLERNRWLPFGFVSQTGED